MDCGSPRLYFSNSAVSLISPPLTFSVRFPRPYSRFDVDFCRHHTRGGSRWQKLVRE
jgi:hypothetical protein